jgi:heme/copper-type cytochrome/quinol oxidase subunit 2
MSFTVTILAVIPIVLILLIAGIIVAARSQHRSPEAEHEGEGGKRMIKTVYTYLILFATLMMTIGGSVAAFMAAADLVSPQSYYMSYEDYKRGYIKDPSVVTPSEPQNQTPAKSEEQLKTDYQNLINEEKERSRERALNSLIKSFGWIIIPLPVFMYYQRRLRHE